MNNILNIWPEVLDREINRRAFSIISRDYCKQAAPELEDFLEDLKFMPTLRYVIGQLIRIDARELEGLTGIFGLDQFRINYDDVGSEIVFSDLEMYRRKNGITIEDLKLDRVYLFELSEAVHDDTSFRKVQANAELLHKSPSGLSLVKKLAGEVNALDLEGHIGLNWPEVFQRQSAGDDAGKIGTLLACKRYDRLYAKLQNLPVPLEYANHP